MADGENNKCVRCGQEITGKAMKAKDLLFHEDNCFNCSVCSKDLKDVSVYSKEGDIFCEDDYKAKFVPKCGRCLEYITEACVRAMDRTWHEACFSCWSCQKRFSASVGYHEHGGHPLCESCYIEAAVAKCHGCDKPILDKSVTAMGHPWHVTCFVCKDCKRTFEDDVKFYNVDNQPVCGQCAGVVE